jgi:2-hydroxychromene-2-carboxylate isomerase
MAESAQPTFYYDFYSPYSYLAAERVNSDLPVVPEWKPISFGHMLQKTGRQPWSFHRDPDWNEHWAEIRRRATERGLPELKIPAGWPIESYTLLGLRGATFAKGSGRVVAFSLALFRQIFNAGRTLEEDTVLLAGAACELHPNALLKGMESKTVKGALAATTQEAIDRGVQGVPTIAVGDQLFWGDDQVEAAAAALA